MAEQGYGGTGPDWPPGRAPSSPPPTVPFMVPPPPPGYPPYPGCPPSYAVVMEPPKSKIAAALLAFFLGIFGVHNFYLGRTAIAVTQLLLATVGGVFTCGAATLAVAVWSFVECIVILCGGMRDRYGRPLA